MGRSNLFWKSFISAIVIMLNMYGVQAQIAIDADLSDWDSTKFQYDDKNKLWFDFRKDDQFLYMAILKKDNVTKIFTGGGVLLSLSAAKIDKDALGIKFAHSVKQKNSQKPLIVSKEELELLNFKGIASQIIPVFNEWGIQVAWKRTEIDYAPISAAYSYEDRKKVPKNPNIFWAEIQIPLSLLTENIGSTVNYSICLTGADRNKEGEEALIRRRLFDNRNSIHEQELYETFYFTEYFGKIDIDKL